MSKVVREGTMHEAKRIRDADLDLIGDEKRLKHQARRDVEGGKQARSGEGSSQGFQSTRGGWKEEGGGKEGTRINLRERWKWEQDEERKGAGTAEEAKRMCACVREIPVGEGESERSGGAVVQMCLGAAPTADPTRELQLVGYQREAETK